MSDDILADPPNPTTGRQPPGPRVLVRSKTTPSETLHHVWVSLNGQELPTTTNVNRPFTVPFDAYSPRWANDCHYWFAFVPIHATFEGTFAPLRYTRAQIPVEQVENKKGGEIRKHWVLKSEVIDQWSAIESLLKSIENAVTSPRDLFPLEQDDVQRPPSWSHRRTFSARNKALTHLSLCKAALVLRMAYISYLICLQPKWDEILASQGLSWIVLTLNQTWIPEPREPRVGVLVDATVCKPLPQWFAHLESMASWPGVPIWLSYGTSPPLDLYFNFFKAYCPSREAVKKILVSNATPASALVISATNTSERSMCPKPITSVTIDIAAPKPPEGSRQWQGQHPREFFEEQKKAREEKMVRETEAERRLREERERDQAALEQPRKRGPMVFQWVQPTAHLDGQDYWVRQVVSRADYGKLWRSTTPAMRVYHSVIKEWDVWEELDPSGFTQEDDEYEATHPDETRADSPVSLDEVEEQGDSYHSDGAMHIDTDNTMHVSSCRGLSPFSQTPPSTVYPDQLGRGRPITRISRSPPPHSPPLRGRNRFRSSDSRHGSRSVSPSPHRSPRPRSLIRRRRSTSRSVLHSRSVYRSRLRRPRRQSPSYRSRSPYSNHPYSTRNHHYRRRSPSLRHRYRSRSPAPRRSRSRSPVPRRPRSRSPVPRRPRSRSPVPRRSRPCSPVPYYSGARSPYQFCRQPHSPAPRRPSWQRPTPQQYSSLQPSARSQTNIQCSRLGHAPSSSDQPPSQGVGTLPLSNMLLTKSEMEALYQSLIPSQMPDLVHTTTESITQVLRYRYGFKYDASYRPQVPLSSGINKNSLWRIWSFHQTNDPIPSEWIPSLLAFTTSLVEESAIIPASLSDLGRVTTSMTLSQTPKAASVRVVQLRDPTSTRTAYLLAGSQLTSADFHWELVIESATTVAEVLRRGCGTDKRSIAYELVKRGISFKIAITTCRSTLADVTESSGNLNASSRVHSGLGWRLPGFIANSYEYFVYEQCCSAFLCREKHAYTALLQGGILWRLARQYLEDETILDGPRASSQYQQEIVIDDKIYVHDVLSSHEQDLICGVYKVLNGDFGGPKPLYWKPAETTTARDYSWWPKQSTWLTSGANVSYWSSMNEEWFQKRLELIHTHQAKPLTSAEWRENLKYSKSSLRSITTKVDRLSAAIL